MWDAAWPGYVGSGDDGSDRSLYARICVLTDDLAAVEAATREHAASRIDPRGDLGPDRAESDRRTPISILRHLAAADAYAQVLERLRAILEAWDEDTAQADRSAGPVAPEVLPQHSDTLPQGPG